MSARVVHCRRAPFDVYIGRGRNPRTGQLGEWGNPYTHRPSRVPEVVVVSTVEEAIELHRLWIWAQLKLRRLSLSRLASLDGATLGCWCGADAPCHGWNYVRASAWAARVLAASPGRIYL
jgi:hypothetical protein